MRNFDNIKEKLADFFTRERQNRLFIVSVLVMAASVANVIADLLPTPVNIVLYTLAGMGLVFTITVWTKMLKRFITVVLIPFVEGNRLLKRFFGDYRFRSMLMAVPGTGLSFCFAIFNAVIGITGRSAWFGSLAAYYVFLVAMRVMAVNYARKNVKGEVENTALRERKVYKTCGILLSCLSMALSGAGIMLFKGVGGKSYPGFLIYVAALYTFCKVINSARHMVRARKENSLLLVTLRNIGHTDALVSMLSLQTAMFAAFTDGPSRFSVMMNAISSAAVAVAALAIGLSMVFSKKGKDVSI